MKGRRFPRPNGYLVYLAEATGRECSKTDLLTTRAMSSTANPPSISTKNRKCCKHGGALAFLSLYLVVRFYVNSKQWWDLVINQVPENALEGHRR